jgi:hypothetical protein
MRIGSAKHGVAAKSLGGEASEKVDSALSSSTKL